MKLNELKKGDKVWNVSFDRFKECIVKEISIKKYNKAIYGGTEFELVHITTEEGENVFKDSYYKNTLDSWFATYEEADKERNRLVDYHKNQIEKHKSDLLKLQTK